MLDTYLVLVQNIFRRIMIDENYYNLYSYTDLRDVIGNDYYEIEQMLVKY